MELAIVPGSIADVAKAEGRSVAESFISCDAVIVFDSSGSMATRDARNGRARYDVACEELRALQERLPGKLAVVAFSDSVIFVPGGEPPLLGGGTDLTQALRFVKVADVAGIRIIVVSDGEPNDPASALHVAEEFSGRIDTVYVGPEEMPWGRDFLQQLSRAHRGAMYVADRANELADKVQLLLEGA